MPIYNIGLANSNQDLNTHSGKLKVLQPSGLGCGILIINKLEGRNT